MVAKRKHQPSESYIMSNLSSLITDEMVHGIITSDPVNETLKLYLRQHDFFEAAERTACIACRKSACASMLDIINQLRDLDVKYFPSLNKQTSKTGMLQCMMRHYEDCVASIYRT